MRKWHTAVEHGLRQARMVMTLDAKNRNYHSLSIGMTLYMLEVGGIGYDPCGRLPTSAVSLTVAMRTAMGLLTPAVCAPSS